jgi:predicted NBD/HSP70 family sugar kinase
MIDFNSKKYKIFFILNLIYHYESISRTQLGDITEYRAATISDLVKELLDKDLIKEKGSSNAGRGRNQILLELNNDYLCAIGISIEPNEIMYIVSTIKGDILKTEKQNIPKNSTPSYVVELIISEITKLMDLYREKRILGIGIGDPGLVYKKGDYTVFSSQFKSWENIHLKSIVKDAIKLPVRIESNDNLKALGEKKYGLAKGISDFICLQLGEGIGISIVANNQLVKGAIGAAGELGHTIVTPNDKICICGSYGCIEASASLSAIIAELKRAVSLGSNTIIREFCKNPEDISLEDIKKALDLKDKLCLNVVLQAANLIGIALANAINILNPELVIFEGLMIELGDCFLNTIIQKVNENALAITNKHLSFKITELKDNAASLGAVTLIFEDFLKTDYFYKLCDKSSNETISCEDDIDF